MNTPHDLLLPMLGAMKGLQTSDKAKARDYLQQTRQSVQSFSDRALVREVLERSGVLMNLLYRDPLNDLPRATADWSVLIERVKSSAVESWAGAEPITSEQMVTLDQAASIVNRAKPTLRRYYDNAKLPEPDVMGGSGRPHEWKWANLRPVLAELFQRDDLPERFPTLRP